MHVEGIEILVADVVLPPPDWALLDEYLARDWPHERGIALPISACCIDSGYYT